MLVAGVRVGVSRSRWLFAKVALAEPFLRSVARVGVARVPSSSQQRAWVCHAALVCAAASREHDAQAAKGQLAC